MADVIIPGGPEDQKRKKQPNQPKKTRGLTLREAFERGRNYALEGQERGLDTDSKAFFGKTLSTEYGPLNLAAKASEEIGALGMGALRAGAELGKRAGLYEDADRAAGEAADVLTAAGVVATPVSPTAIRPRSPVLRDKVAKGIEKVRERRAAKGLPTDTLPSETPPTPPSAANDARARVMGIANDVYEGETSRGVPKNFLSPQAGVMGDPLKGTMTSAYSKQGGKPIRMVAGNDDNEIISPGQTPTKRRDPERRAMADESRALLESAGVKNPKFLSEQELAWATSRLARPMDEAAKTQLVSDISAMAERGRKSITAPDRLLAPANDGVVVPLRIADDGPGVYQPAAPRTPTEWETLQRRIDELDEKDGRGLLSDAEADELDQLLDREYTMQMDARGRNDNISESTNDRLDRELGDAERAYNNLAFGDDERRFARRNTKAYKAYEAELAALEKQYRDKTAGYVRDWDDAKLKKEFEARQGYGTPWDKAVRAEWERRANAETNGVEFPESGKDTLDAPVLDKKARTEELLYKQNLTDDELDELDELLGAVETGKDVPDEGIPQLPKGVLEVYHGSADGKIKQFRLGMGRNGRPSPDSRDVISFSTDPKFARDYAGERGDVTTSYVDTNDFADFRNPDDVAKVKEYWNARFDKWAEGVKKTHGHIWTDEKLAEERGRWLEGIEEGDWTKWESPAVLDYLGKDGVFVRERNASQTDAVNIAVKNLDRIKMERPTPEMPKRPGYGGGDGMDGGSAPVSPTKGRETGKDTPEDYPEGTRRWLYERLTNLDAARSRFNLTPGKSQPNKLKAMEAFNAGVSRALGLGDQVDANKLTAAQRRAYDEGVSEAKAMLAYEKKAPKGETGKDAPDEERTPLDSLRKAEDALISFMESHRDIKNAPVAERKMYLAAKRNLEAKLAEARKAWTDSLGFDPNANNANDNATKPSSVASWFETKPDGETGKDSGNGGTPPGRGGGDGLDGPAPSKSINVENLNTTDDVKDLFDAVEEGVPGPERVSHASTREAANELGMTETEFLKSDGLKGVEAKAVAARDILKTVAEDTVRLLDEIGDLEDPKAQLALARLGAVAEHIKETVSGPAGRLLNSFKINAERTRQAQVLTGAMATPRGRARIQKLLNLYRGDPEALAKIARDAVDPTLRDKIFSFRYNMMLSGLRTHLYNVLGTAANLTVDLAEHGMAAALGLRRKWSGDLDRVTGREMSARLTGAILGARNGLKTMRQAYREGRPADEATRADMERGRVGAWEVPVKALAAEDEFFRSVAYMSNLYGEAVRMAHKEGLRGQAFKDRVQQLINDPPKELSGNSTEYAKRMRFQDDPSFLGRLIERGRTVKKGDNPLTAFGKDVLALVLPFVRTPDSLIRTALRRSGLPGILEGQNWNDLKAGGARRDIATARIAMGMGVTAYIAQKVLGGEITGEGPRNYKEKQALELTGWQANSIKVGDKYYSYEGLEPLSILLNSVATTIESVNEMDGKGYVDKAAVAVFNAAEVLANQSWAEGLSDLFDAMDAPEGQRDAAINTYLANIAASFAVPAVTRQTNQAFFDNVTRDTRGNDSLGDRVVGRIQSGIPGLSDDLPAQLDALGREIGRGDAVGPDILSRASTPLAQNTPVAEEVARLMKSDPEGKTLLNRVDRSINTADLPLGRLNAKEHHDYQLVTGTYFTALMEEALQDPEYLSLSDDEKRAELRDMAKNARAWAREEVFGSPE